MLRLVVFLALFAMVVYAFFWLLERRRGKGGGGKAKLQPIPRGPVGPDDDEDFLRELERRRRHSKDANKGGQDGGRKGAQKNGQKDGRKDAQKKDLPPQKDAPRKDVPEKHPPTQDGSVNDDQLTEGATPDVPAKDEES